MKRLFVLIGILALLSPAGVSAGSAAYTTPGWYYFSVPAYSYLTVYVNGAGGADGGDSYGDDGSPGENSGFYATWAGLPDVMGGGGGPGHYDDNYPSFGTPGSAWGGNVANTTGAGAAGGRDSGWGTGGGAGGQAVSSYSQGQLPQGGTIPVYVGTGGPAVYNAGPCETNTDGCNGSVYIYWSDPPPASCSVWFDQNPIAYGGATVLRWNSSNADAWVYINSVGYVGGSGAIWVAPTTNTDYSCIAYGSGATDGWHGAVLYVNPPPAPTCSVWFSRNPMPYGGGATVYWSSSSASNVYINSVGWVNPSGSTAVNPAASTDYSCVGYSGAYGYGGWTGATLSVTPPAAPTATITSSLGTSILVGQSTTITATYYPVAGDPFSNTTINIGGTSVIPYSSATTRTYTFTPGSAGNTTFLAYGMTSYYSSWTVYNSITVAAAPASCTLNGTTLQQGESATFYTQQVAPSGQLCSAIAQTRTCSNGVLSGSVSYQYSNCTCAPLYSCSGANVTYTNGSCSTSTVASCVSPRYCSPGVTSCVTPPPTFVVGAGTTGHLQVKPQVVRVGTTAKVYWNVSNVSACTVTGTNGDSWTGASGVKTTAAITQKTTYTLSCTGIDGSAVRESASVNVTPTFQEK